MKTTLLQYLISILLIVSLCSQAYGQDTIELKGASYTRTINERADKIAAKLGISNAKKYQFVKQVIADQYRNLNAIYENRDEQKKSIKASYGTNKILLDSLLKILEKEVTEKVALLHVDYLKALNKKLSEKQVIQIKDGMTYGVLPITYKGYQDMIPTLTEPQKVQILAWLTEAREYAMDAESSEKKHAWFGKYKGKINNYLSAQGYDSKKEREAWEKRIKEAAALKH